MDKNVWFVIAQYLFDMNDNIPNDVFNFESNKISDDKIDSTNTLEILIIMRTFQDLVNLYGPYSLYLYNRYNLFKSMSDIKTVINGFNEMVPYKLSKFPLLLDKNNNLVLVRNMDNIIPRKYFLTNENIKLCIVMYVREQYEIFEVTPDNTLHVYDKHLYILDNNIVYDYNTKFYYRLRSNCMPIMRYIDKKGFIISENSEKEKITFTICMDSNYVFKFKPKNFNWEFYEYKMYTDVYYTNFNNFMAIT